MFKTLKDYSQGIPVDPDADHFTSINEAAAWADAVLPAGDPVVIRLAPGKTHALAGGEYIHPAGRDLFIFSVPVEEEEPGGTATRPAIIDGNLELSDNDAGATSRMFSLNGVQLNGDLTVLQQWVASLKNGRMEGALSVTNGVNQSQVYFDSYGGGITSIVFTDAGGELVFRNLATQANVNGAGWITVVESTNVYFDNAEVVAVVLGTGSSLVDWAGGNNHQVYWKKSVVQVLKADPTFTFELYHDPAANCQTYTYDLHIYLEAASDVDLISGTHQEYGQPKVTSDPDANRPAILNPGPGVEWVDEMTRESLVWDGTYWDCGGGVKRQEVVVDIGGAAADHDVGFDAPAGSAVIKASIRLLKDITLGGGPAATDIGHGTKAAGDPDKYGELGAVVSGTTQQVLNASAWPDGAGDDFGITGTDGAGNAQGTLAGSGDADARCMYWFALPTELTE